jgi:hypothetical protein
MMLYRPVELTPFIKTWNCYPVPQGLLWSQICCVHGGRSVRFQTGHSNQGLRVNAKW